MKRFIYLALGCLLTVGTMPQSTSAMEEYKNPVEFNDFINSIEDNILPESDYVVEIHEKTQHCIHHTASGKGVSGDIRHFSKPGRIITPTIIGHDSVVRLHDHKYWGYHLGIPKSQFNKMGIAYQRLDKICIGTEIDSWGPLKLINGEFRAWPNEYGTGTAKERAGKTIKVVVPENEVIEYADGFRGYNFFQKYTDFQIGTLEYLCKYYNDKHGIPMNYRGDMWDVCEDALKGVPGTYTHVSYRPDKSDCHPQPELISMLKSLS